MNWRQINTALIPWSDYVEELFHPKGKTEDIIRAVLEGDSEHDTRFYDFAWQFPKTKEGLKLLWKFTRKAIHYKEDEFGVQNVKLAAALWKVRKGDCKSKTLFINQVLKCLEIPYITRFVGYDGEQITHVYSIAFLNGQPIVLDSVFRFFDAEPKHNVQKDFDMTRVSLIRGIPKTNKGLGTAEAEDLYFQAQEEALKKHEEIQQRKQFVQPEQPINFATVSEGEALLELLIRKLKIIGTMKDEQRATTERGIGLIRNSIKTGKVSSGVIPDGLQGVAERINYYLTLNGSAVGHGYRGKALEFFKLKARNSPKIGTVPGAGVPGMECLTNLWFLATGGSGTQLDPFLYQTYNNDLSLLGNRACNSRTLQQFNQNANQIYFFYGRNSTFRVDFNQGGPAFNTILNDFVSANSNLISDAGYGKYIFQNQASYDALLEELKQKMPVLSNWANNLFAADNLRANGTVGTGLLYNFVPYLNQIASINSGDFPSIVQTKMVFQRQYIDSCVNFSTISRIIFEDMSENGILFDNGGETPERILSALLQSYNPNIGLEPTTVTAIVTIITAILGGVAGIASALNKGASNAATIDDAKQQTANYRIQSSSTLPSDLDFLRPSNGGNNNGGNNNGGSGGGNNKKEGSILPLAAALGLGLWAASKKKKN